MFYCLLAVAWQLLPINSCPIPKSTPYGDLGGLSGLAYLGTNDMYYAACDSRDLGAIYPLQIGIKRSSGMVTNVVVGAPQRLAKRSDMEAIAIDHFRPWVWVTDERDCSIRAFCSYTGKEQSRLKLPAFMDAYRCNRALESLTISTDGLTLWTCNEEALNHQDALGRTRWGDAPVSSNTPNVDDGPCATTANGTWVRLLRYTRKTFTKPWVLRNVFAYQVDPIGGRSFIKRSSSGASELLMLPDGTLLLLEREMSIKKGLPIPTFRSRIYAVDTTDATDIQNVVSLAKASFTPVRKQFLWGATTGLAMYEGMTLGPRLKGGSQSLLLISDGDEGAANSVKAFRLIAQ